jgi:methenyltetrahydromethanopterin cyclohydrolase
MVELELNERAWALADDCEARAAELRVAVSRLPGGARVLDCGIGAEGGWEAGLLVAGLCMGGLGRVEYVPVTIDGDDWTGV